MAKRTKLDSYLASLRTPQINGNTMAAAPTAPTLENPMPPRPIDDASAADVADDLAGPPVDSPATRAYPATVLHRTSVAGIGHVAVVAHPDGQPDRAIAATGQTVAKYRRVKASEPARQWWVCRTTITSDDVAASLISALCILVPNDVRPHAPAAARKLRGAQDSLAATSEIDRARTATHDGGPIGDEPAPPVRSADPGVCAVIDRIVCPRAQDAAAIKAAALAELRAGTIEAIAAWASAAWLEGRAVILFGDRRRNAELAAAALREACSEYLRAAPARDSYSLAVDDVLAAVGE